MIARAGDFYRSAVFTVRTVSLAVSSARPIPRIWRTTGALLCSVGRVAAAVSLSRGRGKYRSQAVAHGHSFLTLPGHLSLSLARSFSRLVSPPDIETPPFEAELRGQCANKRWIITLKIKRDFESLYEITNAWVVF